MVRKLPRETQHKIALGLEHRWQGEAAADSRYNKNMSKVNFDAGNKVLGEFYLQEARMDTGFVPARKRIENQQSRFVKR